MAINYPKLFGDIGKAIKASNGYASIASTTLPADLTSVLQQLGTGSTTFGDAVGPGAALPGQYANFQNNVVAWRQGLLQFAKARLNDNDTVLSQLNLPVGVSLPTLLVALMQDMVNAPQNVQANTVTLGAPSLLAGTLGNGTVLMDKILDGFNAPVANGFATLFYNGLNSELAVNETQQFTCTQDSGFPGTSEGGESWAWTGGPSYGQFDYHPEGSGSGPSITTAHAATILQNLNFNTWSGNVPSQWTVDSGSSAVFQETGTPANLFRGASALRFTGNGTATIQISQAPSLTQLQPRRRYCFTARVKQTGALAGNLVIKFNSASGAYTAAGSEQINTAASGIPGTYTLYNFFINFPAITPGDLRLIISAQNTLTSGANLWVDSCSFAPVIYFGGVNATIISGTQPWTVGDRISVPVANNQAGLIQEFFRRGFYCQLPSVPAGPTLGNGLAS